MTRLMAILISIFVLTVPAEAQRPRPLGWAMDAMRSGSWDAAAALAARPVTAAASGSGRFSRAARSLARPICSRSFSTLRATFLPRPST